MKLPSHAYWVLIVCADFCTASLKVVEGTGVELGEVDESEMRLSASGVTREEAFKSACRKATRRGIPLYINLINEKEREQPVPKPG